MTDGKQGVDDFLVANGKKALQKLLMEQTAHPITLIAIIDPSAPLEVARQFVSIQRQQIISYQGDTYAWHATHYQKVPAEILRARLYNHLESGQSIGKDGKFTRTKPTANTISNVADAVRAATELHTLHGLTADENRCIPFWLRGAGRHTDPKHLLACQNGLLNLGTRTLLPHTPDFFNVTALPFEYERKAVKPGRWLQFIGELWPNDQESANTLQEIIALLLTADTCYQKIFMIVGPKRSGKGTILRLLVKLLGQSNVASPTLDALTRNFGLEPLIGKTLAVISDARLGSGSDQKIVTERLLAISGEDSQTIDRKHRAAWHGRLSVRFLITTNEIPRIADASGALSSRFVVLKLSQSFYGREDQDLDAKLAAELPGILNWALDGLDRLRKRGRFIQPRSARQDVELLQDLTSPMSAFIRDCCEIGEGYVPTDELFKSWGAWCMKTGREHTGSRETFGRDLLAAEPRVVRGQKRRDGKVIPIYKGLRLGVTGVTSDNPMQQPFKKGSD